MSEIMKPAHLPDLAHAIDIFPTIAAAAGLKALQLKEKIEAWYLVNRK